MRINMPGQIRDAEGKQAATAQYKGPAEKSNPTRHEKARRVNCATVEDNPTERWPQHGERIRNRRLN